LESVGPRGARTARQASRAHCSHILLPATPGAGQSRGNDTSTVGYSLSLTPIITNITHEALALPGAYLTIFGRSDGLPSLSSSCRCAGLSNSGCRWRSLRPLESCANFPRIPSI